MNILIVIGQYYPVIGGAEAQAQKQAETLHKLGVNIEVLTYHRRGLATYEEINGVPVYRLRGFLYKKIKLYSLILSAICFIRKNQNKYNFFKNYVLFEKLLHFFT